MSNQQDVMKEDNLARARRPYMRPEIKRVDLALEETLSAGCKLVDGCGEDFDPEGGQAGS